MATFYEILQTMLKRSFNVSFIYNYNESKAQVGHIKKGQILIRTSGQGVNSTLSKKQE